MRLLARALSDIASRGARKALLIGEIDAEPGTDSPFGAALVEVGFTRTSSGYFKRGASGQRAV